MSSKLMHRCNWVCVWIFTLLPVALSAQTIPVPGGIYSWSVPEGVTTVSYDNAPVFVFNNTALVGIPFNSSPGEHTLHYQRNGTEIAHHFTVHPKEYTEQRLTIKNQNMVNPPAPKAVDHHVPTMP